MPRNIILWGLRFLCVHTLTHSLTVYSSNSFPLNNFRTPCQTTGVGVTGFKARTFPPVRGVVMTSLLPYLSTRFSSHGTNAPPARLHRCRGEIHA
jgi:hypothetical protein